MQADKISGSAARRSAKPGLQAEKSASTRTRILEATVECLVEKGYAHTTTVEVAERAGVSRGAMLHHYKSKVDIVHATMDYLMHKRLDQLREGVAAFREGDDVVDASVELFWNMVKHPHFYALQELRLAARTDGELRAVLLPLEARIEEEFFRTNVELFSPFVAPGTPFDGMRDISRFALDGLGMARILHKDEAFARPALELLKKLITELLVAPKLKKRARSKKRK